MDQGKYVVEIRGNTAVLVNPGTGEAIPPDEPIFILRARDKFAIDMLNTYFQMAWKYKCTEPHLASILRIIKVFENFAFENSDQMRLPGLNAGQHKDGKG